jgi:hypothetical protein
MKRIMRGFPKPRRHCFGPNPDSVVINPKDLSPELKKGMNIEDDSDSEKSYVMVNGEKVTMKELVKSDPLLADMIYEGTFGDPKEIIDAHTGFKLKEIDKKS